MSVGPGQPAFLLFPPQYQTQEGGQPTGNHEDGQQPDDLDGHHHRARLTFRGQGQNGSRAPGLVAR